MLNKKIAIVGGDKRDLQVVPALLKEGYDVNVFGLPAEFLPAGANIKNTFIEAVSEVDVVILPLPGIRNTGILHAPFLNEYYVSEEDIRAISENTPILTGVCSPYLKKMAELINAPVIETAEMDIIAINNAIPTAEGAIELAMRETEITIDGMNCLVIGYGRVGSTLATKLRSMNARVTIVNKGVSRFGLAAKEGFSIYPWESFGEILGNFDVIFNTVPALVLEKDQLMNVRSDCFIIDLATAPGGIDFNAAKELGIRAELALSLPGKVAPISAGRVLARAYPQILNRIFENL